MFFITQPQKRHSITSAISSSHRPTLMQCRKELHRGMNTWRCGTLGAPSWGWLSCLCVCVCVCVLFRAAPTAYKGSQAKSNWSCSCQPIPQTQQFRIWAVSSIYTPAHDNAVSEARVCTHSLMFPSQIHFCCATAETPNCLKLKPQTSFILY